MFLGPTPEGVIQQYTEVIGRPFMPPYWSLGFHQCRWGYTTVQETLDVVNRLKAYGIPQVSFLVIIFKLNFQICSELVISSYEMEAEANHFSTENIDILFSTFKLGMA